MSKSSEEAVQLYSKLHAESPAVFAGKNLLTSLPSIRKLSAQQFPGRVLDFGCGKGEQYSLDSYTVDNDTYPTLAKAIAATEVVGFDPCVPKFATRPGGKFIGIIAVDVLNGTPLPDLAAEVQALFAQLEPGGWLFVRATLADSKKAINDPFWQKYGRTVSDYLAVCRPPAESRACVVVTLQTSHTGRQDWCTWRYNEALDYEWYFQEGVY